MELRAINDNIIFRVKEDPKPSGILVPESYAKAGPEIKEGIVVSIGAAAKEKTGLDQGDSFLYLGYGATKVDYLKGIPLMMIQSSSVIAQVIQ